MAAVGIDTPSIDYGQSPDFRSHVLLYSEKPLRIRERHESGATTADRELCSGAADGRSKAGAEARSGSSPSCRVDGAEQLVPDVLGMAGSRTLPKIA